MPNKTNATWPQKPLSEVVDLNPRLDKSVYRDDLEVSFLEEALIPVPLFEDQQRIVAEIEKQFSRLDEAVASLKRTKANRKRYKAAVEANLTRADCLRQSILHQAFSGKLARAQHSLAPASLRMRESRQAGLALLSLAQVSDNM